MQVVGRECEVCLGALLNERGAVGCERCDVAVHDDCAAPARPQDGPTAQDAPKRKRARSTICPRCGDDLRALQRDRDRAHDALHNGRKKAGPSTPQSTSARALVISLVAAVVVLGGLTGWWAYREQVAQASWPDDGIE